MADEHVHVGVVDEAGTWEHDDETGGEVLVLRADDAVEAGLWRPGEMSGQTIDLVLVANESLIVLAGSGRLEADGRTIDLRAGVMVSLTAGTRTRWRVDDDFREFWVYTRGS